MGTPNKNSCKTAAVINLIGKGPARERDIQILQDKPQDIEAVAGEPEERRLSELAKNIRAAEAQNQQLAQLMLSNAVDIGRWLTEAKVMVPHGEWGKWLKENVDYSQSKAQNLMRLYQEYGSEQESLFQGPKSQALGNLSVTKVLQLLAIPEGPEREEFLEAHDVAAMSTRELDAAIKERNEARLAAAQAQADLKAADAAREKLSQDMALANKRIEGLNAEVAEKSAKVKETQDTVAQLEKELEEFRSRPVDVAVQADEAAVEAARKEVEERMQAQIDAARKAQAQADEARKAALADLAKAQASLEQAQADMRAVQDQIAKTEKKAALTTDPDLALCNELFDQSQVLFNMMYGVLMKKRNKEPEKAEKLQNAMLTLLDKERKMVLG